MSGPGRIPRQRRGTRAELRSEMDAFFLQPTGPADADGRAHASRADDRFFGDIPRLDARDSAPHQRAATSVSAGAAAAVAADHVAAPVYRPHAPAALLECALHAVMWPTKGGGDCALSAGALQCVPILV
jgi:hypothetical protein